MPEIVILNHCFLTQKHISRLKELGTLTVYSDTDTEEKAIERLQNADIAIIDPFICALNSSIINNLSKTKYISLVFTGFDMVDVDAAKAKGIQISNVPEYGSQSVAEQVIALMFAVVRKIALGDRKIREKPFEIDVTNELHNKFIGFNVEGKTLGILGFGHIGERVAKLAKGLGMKVISHTRHPEKETGAEFVSFEELLKQADILSLNIPLTKETENIISDEEFKMMKTDAILINTARGKLVNGPALFNALKTGGIEGAGLDILPEMENINDLLLLENVVFTPHSAFFTKESLQNLADTVVNNVESYLKGAPKNLVT